MHTGIIVYSRTGHTLSVARQLEERLSAEGHQVTLVQLEIDGPLVMSASTAPLKTRPAVDPYDALVLGSPVNGGRMSAAMNTYLQRTPSLQGKNIALLLTHFFFPSWGANQTIAQMRELCESKGATVCGSGTVRWTSLRRGRQVRKVVDGLTGCLQS